MLHDKISIVTCRIDPLFQAPFRAETEDEMFDAIMRDELVCPHYLSREAKNLLHAVRILLFRLLKYMYNNMLIHGH